ncbi:DUF2085 domain-containing protein [Neobacillus thermocopriae]|uniref:DUF2085 domain-containing protein n=1 Tax=Neobacillus thermocopriae TaxID=1215031 RepID=A0A6B3TKW7_9BACI|nr:DUF2085 domain-containing protein [Neobacillus thermocopriae]MED3622505.1 DUF2085 domain-containing protein [Neobacillus thermocopriae]MED3714014.1 DUF2085 domain-containing protein [Neobacillus thermocopriae]NEX77328.1 DUF2085 domain-containing protein [Neobacillus thermocopriae]
MLEEIMHFLGRAICHQLEERSLLVSEKPLSVCARCTGIYIGILSTCLYLFIVKRKTSITIPTIKMSFFLLLFMLPLIIDGLGSYAHLFNSDNVRRLITGICFGLVLPFFIYPLLSEKSLKQNSVPVIRGNLDILAPTLISLLIGGLVYAGLFSYGIINILILLTIMMWFSLLTSLFFTTIGIQKGKWVLSVLSSFFFLLILSTLHQIIIS